MAESSHRTTIVIAIIGLIGTLGGALLGNWDKVFPPPTQLPPEPEALQTTLPKSPRIETSPETTRLEQEPLTEVRPNINGVWLDRDHPGNGSKITQDGNTFRFTRWGALPNGVGFEVSGRGTITGQRFTSHYDATYTSGMRSEGGCSGTISADGGRIELNCRDSALGDFPVTSIRQ